MLKHPSVEDRSHPDEVNRMPDHENQDDDVALLPLHPSQRLVNIARRNWAGILLGIQVVCLQLWPPARRNPAQLSLGGASA